jgi:uncharacterized Rmd1/YagE family protein
MGLDCSFYCLCASYNLAAISSYLRDQGIKNRIYSKDVLHFKQNFNKKSYDLFIFSYGCIVFWGMENDAIDSTIKELKAFSNDPLPRVITDRCSYKTSSDSENSYIDMEDDVIVIHKDENSYLAKLAFSYGLSQSVKLSVFEDSVDKTIEDNQNIPDELINTGKVSLSKKALGKKIGSLFAERNYINLNNNILDTPEFFWKHPKYEQYYEMSIRFLDLTQRIHVLNSKLDIIRDLYRILSEELQHAQSSRLEIVVILLIFLEVCIGLLELFIAIVKH